MFHITHPTSFLSTRGEPPLGALMIDGTARTNDRSVLVDKKPVSANDMAAEWGQLQSERALFCWFCMLGQVVCVSAHAVTSWHLSLSDTLQLSQRSPYNGLILISWFKAERWTAGRVFFSVFLLGCHWWKWVLRMLLSQQHKSGPQSYKMFKFWCGILPLFTHMKEKSDSKAQLDP